MTCGVTDCTQRAELIQVDPSRREMTIVCSGHKTASWFYSIPFIDEETRAAYESETRAFHLEAV